jgi:hypothetical protein
MPDCAHRTQAASCERTTDPSTTSESSAHSIPSCVVAMLRRCWTTVRPDVASPQLCRDLGTRHRAQRQVAVDAGIIDLYRRGSWRYAHGRSNQHLATVGDTAGARHVEIASCLGSRWTRVVEHAADGGSAGRDGDHSVMGRRHDGCAHWWAGTRRGVRAGRPLGRFNRRWNPDDSAQHDVQ